MLRLALQAQGFQQGGIAPDIIRVFDQVAAHGLPAIEIGKSYAALGAHSKHHNVAFRVCEAVSASGYDKAGDFVLEAKIMSPAASDLFDSREKVTLIAKIIVLAPMAEALDYAVPAGMTLMSGEHVILPL